MQNSAWTSITLGKKSQENSTAGQSSAYTLEDDDDYDDALRLISICLGCCLIYKYYCFKLATASSMFLFLLLFNCSILQGGVDWGAVKNV